MDEKSSKKKPKSSTMLLKISTAVLFAILLAELVAFAILGNKEAFADWLVAIGTTLLAFITFLSIAFNRIQAEQHRSESLESEERYRKAELEKEERYRQDQRNREDRERKERLLNEIDNWVQNLNLGLMTIFNDTISDESHGMSIPRAALASIFVKKSLLIEAEQINLEYFLMIAHEFSIGMHKTIENLKGSMTTLSKSIFDLAKKYAEYASLEQAALHEEELQTLFGNTIKESNNVSKSISELIIEVAKAKLALLKE